MKITSSLSRFFKLLLTSCLMGFSFSFLCFSVKGRLRGSVSLSCGWGEAEPDWLELSDWGSCAEAKDARKKTNASRNERLKTRLGKLSRDMEGELLTHNSGDIIL